MKPIKLVMKAFGTYKDKQIIDFTLLNDNNLFLITGATGSGKTTIFDAICYALYGEASGEDRSSKGLRSDYAASDVLTEVEFDFIIKDIKYSIKRMPEQERPNKRGAGMTLQNASVILKTPNGLITKIKDADDKIKDILGIDAKQFRQIVMIPQGEFRKLLTEESGEREKILKELFNTYVYGKIEDVIKLKAKDLFGESRKLIDIRKSEIEKIECASDTDLYVEINAEYKNIDNVIKFTNEAIENDKKIGEGFKEDIQALTKVRDSLIEKKMDAERDNNLLNELKNTKNEKEQHQSKKQERDSNNSCARKGEQAKSIEPYEKNYNNAKRQLNTANDNLSKLKDSIASGQAEIKSLEEEYKKYNSDEHKEYVKNINNDFNTMQGYIPKVEALEEIEDEIEEVDNRIKELSQNSSNLIDKISDKQKKIVKLKAEHEIASWAKNELAGLNMELDKEQRTKEYLEKLKNKAVSRTEKSKKIDAQNALAGKLKNNLDKIDKDLKIAKLGYHKNQAYLIAKDLKEGDECPVCGSKEHAKLAEPYENAVTKDNLDKMEETQREVLKQYNEAGNQLVKLKSEHKNLNENIEEILLEIRNIAELPFTDYSDDKTIEAAEKEILKREKQIQSIENKIEEKRQLSESADGIDKNIKRIGTEIEADNKTLKELEAEHGKVIINKERHNTKLKSIYDEVPGLLRTKSALGDEIEKLKQIISQAEKSQAEALQKYTEKNNEISQLKGEEKGMIGEIAQKEKILNDALSEFEKAIEKSIFTNTNEYNDAKEYIENIEKYSNAVKEYDKRSTEIDTRLNELIKKTEGMECADIQKIEDEIEDERAKIEQLNKEQSGIQNRIKNNISHIKEIESRSKSIEKIDAEYRIVKNLSNAISGDNPLRISLERYVLAAYLDDIIRAANKRLDKMTQERYILKRSTELTDKRKQSGLELEVLDNYTGKARNVRTLSGGESFLASLSMALGLSDVVQSYAGGIQLDTMFIDEGFGTLDPETLDGAVNTLISLKESGRLIGIISHVEELKERIDVRLEVKGSISGSSARFAGV